MQQPKGVLRVPTKEGDVKDPLLKVGLNFSAALNSATAVGGASGFTIPTGRGPVKAIEVLAGSSTLSDLAVSYITILANGVQILYQENLMAFSNLFQNDQRCMVIDIPEAAVITGQVQNNSGTNNIPIGITFYFYNPYRQ